MKVMDTYKHVRNAFYSGEHAFNGDRQIIQDIAFLVDEQYLLLRVFPVASHQEYLAILHNLEKNKRSDDAAGGGNEHITLKILSGEHLQKSFGLKVLYEHPLCGYYPDVITTDNSIVVECGHTHNPEKMLTYFRQSDIKECICVPYPDPDEQNVFGYSFSASKELKDFLSFWDKEKYSDIRKKLGR